MFSYALQLVKCNIVLACFSKSTHWVSKKLYGKCIQIYVKLLILGWRILNNKVWWTWYHIYKWEYIWLNKYREYLYEYNHLDNNLTGKIIVQIIVTYCSGKKKTESKMWKKLVYDWHFHLQVARNQFYLKDPV